MRYRLLNKVVAMGMTVFMAVNGMASYVYADGTGQVGTVYGAEETLDVSMNEYSRENNFNENWKFYLGTSSLAQNKNFDDSSWESVSLPHDFSIAQNFTTNGEAESGFLPGGTGWYRKHFVMSSQNEGKHILLSFDGVYADAYVYVNDQYVGEHHYGYTNFAFDITEYLTMDGITENVIAVKAVNNLPTSRWYSGSGIYRDVTLIVTDDVHVDYNGTKVTTPDIESGTGTVNIAVDVKNEGAESVTAQVTNTVYQKGQDTALAVVAKDVEIPANGMVTVESTETVEDPQLWSIENPNLYTVHTSVSVGGVETDSYDTTFGFRYFSFDSQGFHLNGENVKLNGVCMHHDQGALGSAAYYDAMYRQLSIMKDMGCNAIRTSHNPADEDFIKICSELGLVVIEEAFDGLVDVKNSNTNDFSNYFEVNLDAANNIYGGNSSMTWSEYAIKSMVKRDRNEPAIIAWSMGNEIQEGTNWAQVSRYAAIIEKLIGYVQELDTTRPTTSGDNNRGGSNDLVNVINTITNNGGIAGFNYANDVNLLDSLLKNYGGSKGVIIASETSSAVNSRGIYMGQAQDVNNNGTDRKYHLTSYDTSCVSWGLTAHESLYNTYQLDGVAGEFVWTGFDYIGEPTPWNGTTKGEIKGSGATPNSSYFGIVETTGFEKDSYYLYRSQWNKSETTLHLVTAWDSDNMVNTSGKTPVWVYSNAPIVKLYRDDTLVGTATREAHTSPAGHTYYTYTTESANTNICTTSSGTRSEGLYAIFNVAYQAGTLSARAFESDGETEITLTGNCGRHTVTTPGTVSKLVISQNKETMPADGSSLAYITVDVTDANGNLDTTATNEINFTLEGNGEIVGVDNGDQATVNKYQQRSVLTSSTSAKIKAYAGKALVIVRSAKDAGSMTVQISSDNLEGGSVVITTTNNNVVEKEGLRSYTLVRDYSVFAGTAPELLTTAKGNMSDGTTITGTVSWNDINGDIYNTVGDYTVNGTISFSGYEEIPVVAKLHVISDVIAVKNVATATAQGTVPTLPDVVSGVMPDGTISGEFHVSWEDVTAEQFAELGQIVTVRGTAAILGDKTLPVTCSVRVAEVISTESYNVAPQASLSQDIPTDMQSDNLSSINNEVLKPGDNTSERWTNWNNRNTSAEATLTFTWATAQILSSVNLYYYYDGSCKYPDNIEFFYSYDGVDYKPIAATSEMMEEYYLGASYRYTFDSVINPISVQIKFTQKNGTSNGYCVGLTEAEMMTFAGAIEYEDSAVLNSITVDGNVIEGFGGDTYEYTATGSDVLAASDSNVGITILPVYNDVVRILTVSEDGSQSHTYAVTLQKVVLSEPSVTVSASAAASNTIKLTGRFEDYENINDYYEVTAHGLVYMQKSKLGSRNLTVNTAGRTKVSFKSYQADGSFSYTMKPSSVSSYYTVRAFLEYKDAMGVVHYIYSKPLVVNYNGL